MRRVRAGLLLIATTVGCVSLLAPAASAATQVGETFLPNATFVTDYTLLQTSSPGGQYRVPAPGVITSWSFEANASPPDLKLKIGRPAGGDNYTIVGDSPLKLPVPNQLNTYTDVRIPVQTGDIVGHYLGSTPGASYRSAMTHLYHTLSGDQMPGTTVTFGGPFPNAQLDISVSVEPDCDGDGFGDETQDPDISSCNPPGDIAAPETTITKKPKNKTKKKRATFEFTSTEPDATFDCVLDGKSTFKPCTSPLTVKVKKGKHSFSVQATDAAGNLDGTPATDSWKVKKKKKKKKKK